MALLHKITITPAGGGSAVTLGESPDAAPVSGETGEHQRLTQVQDLVRASAPALRGRGNARLAMSFNVTRQHANIYTAIKFSIEHPLSVPEAGTLLIEIEDGETTKSWTGEAIVPAVKMLERRGTTTRWQYMLVVTNLTEVVEE